MRSVVIRVINKIGGPRSGRPIFLSRACLQKELDDKKSGYHLIITISVSENTPRKNIFS